MSCTHSTDEEAEVGGLSALKLPWVPNTLRITIKFLQALPFSVQHPPPPAHPPHLQKTSLCTILSGSRLCTVRNVFPVPSPPLVNFYAFFSIQLFVPLGKEGAPVCRNCALTGLPHQNSLSLWAFHIYLPSACAHPAQAATRGNYLEGAKDSGP